MYRLSAGCLRRAAWIDAVEFALRVGPRLLPRGGAVAMPTLAELAAAG